MTKVIGILGGMGSYATADFFKKILDQFKVKHESDYPHIIIYNQPKLPSRTRAVLYQEVSPLPGMVDACAKLKLAGADFIAIPCNSAHAWYEELSSQTKIPVISILECVKEEVLKHVSPIKKVGVISGEVVIKRKLYEGVFGDKVQVILADDLVENKVREIIDHIKRNQVTTNTKIKALEVVNYFCSQNVDGLILGCTEIPLVLSQDDTPLPIFDSTKILAKRVAELAR